jgi:hypothetical protein
MITSDEALEILDCRELFDWYQVTRDGQGRLRVNARLTKSGKYIDRWGRKEEPLPNLVERLLVERLDGGQEFIEALLNARVI